jgi:transcriptional regulator GlxA family with amidase domain
MHQIVFVIFRGFELLDVSGPASVFNSANWALEQLGREPFYEVGLASPRGGLIESSCGIAVQSDAIASLMPGNVHSLLVAGAEREPLMSAVGNADLRSALPGLAVKAERYGSVCSGGFLLASLGLLDDHHVATHWDSFKPFAAAFPKVKVDADVMYVADGRLWTSAGVSAGIDMAIAMVANDLDASIAGEVAKRLVLYARRPGYQSQFSSVLGAQAKADSPFADLIGWIQSNLAAPLDVTSLAERTNMTERTFYRKFAAATGETPAHFVEIARLDAARMLISRGLSLKAVAAEVGLFPPARLTEAFQRRFGITPRLYREIHSDL